MSTYQLYDRVWKFPRWIISRYERGDRDTDEWVILCCLRVSFRWVTSFVHIGPFKCMLELDATHVELHKMEPGDQMDFYSLEGHVGFRYLGFTKWWRNP